MSRKPTYSDSQWLVIRELYESGRSATEISRMDGFPSHTAIDNRRAKEGWTRDLDVADVALPGNVLDGLTDAQATVIRGIARGYSQRSAAALAGIHEQTVGAWKKDNERFLSAFEVAVAIKTINRLETIETASKSGNIEAAKWLLQRDAHSRADYGGDTQPSGTGHFNVLAAIQLNIPRD